MGSNFVGITSSPEDLSSIGAMLMGLADGLAGQASPIGAKIDSLDSGKPWGNDHFGTAFEQGSGYLATPEGASEPLNQVLKDELGSAGKQLNEIGLAVVNAMSGYSSTESGNQTDIGSIQA